MAIKEMGQNQKAMRFAQKVCSSSLRLLAVQFSIFVVFFLVSLHTMYLTKYIRGKRPTKETRNLLRKARISNKNNAWSF